MWSLTILAVSMIAWIWAGSITLRSDATSVRPRPLNLSALFRISCRSASLGDGPSIMPYSLSLSINVLSLSCEFMSILLVLGENRFYLRSLEPAYLTGKRVDLIGAPLNNKRDDIDAFFTQRDALPPQNDLRIIGQKGIDPG